MNEQVGFDGADVIAIYYNGKMIARIEKDMHGVLDDKVSIQYLSHEIAKKVAEERAVRKELSKKWNKKGSNPTLEADHLKAKEISNE